MPRAGRAWASWNCLKGSRGVRRRRLGVRVVLGEPPSKSAGGRPGSVRDAQPSPPAHGGTIQHHVTPRIRCSTKRPSTRRRPSRTRRGSGGFGSPARGAGTDFTRTGSSRRGRAERMFAGDPSRSKGNLTPVPWDPRPRPAPQPQHEGVHPTVRAGRGILGAARAVLPHDSSGRIRVAVRGNRSRRVESLGVGVDGKPLEEEVVVTVFDQSMFCAGAPRGHRPRRTMDGHFDCDLYALLDLLCSGHPANVGAAAGADSGVPSLGKDPSDRGVRDALAGRQDGVRRRAEQHEGGVKKNIETLRRRERLLPTLPRRHHAVQFWDPPAPGRRAVHGGFRARTHPRG